MELGVSVNAPSASASRPADGRMSPGEWSEIQAEDSLRTAQGTTIPEGLPGRVSESPRGSCLYFGPAGQRCNRPALRGGFCARHQPGTVLDAPAKRLPRRTAAVLALLAAIWPLVADLVRELMRWIHSH